MGRGGSTAVTAILLNGQRLWVANVGDSRAVLSKEGRAVQMSIDHEPNTERGSIENKGGFVSNMPGILQQRCLESLFNVRNIHVKSDILNLVSQERNDWPTFKSGTPFINILFFFTK